MIGRRWWTCCFHHRRSGLRAGERWLGAALAAGMASGPGGVSAGSKAVIAGGGGGAWSEAVIVGEGTGPVRLTAKSGTTVAGASGEQDV